MCCYYSGKEKTKEYDQEREVENADDWILIEVSGLWHDYFIEFADEEAIILDTNFTLK